MRGEPLITEEDRRHYEDAKTKKATPDSTVKPEAAAEHGKSDAPNPIMQPATSAT